MARPNGYVAEHRRVVYDAGIPIPPGAHVHHINHDRLDNRIENLAVLDAAAHMKVTAQERVSEIEQMRAELAEYRRRFGPLNQ